jgi:hypothetical protein
MKTMVDIKQDMSELYDELKAQKLEVKTAAELANIAGKYLKAEQLILAREIFESSLAKKMDVLPDSDAQRLLEAA